jgi:hypothetical protein
MVAERRLSTSSRFFAAQWRRRSEKKILQGELSEALARQQQQLRQRLHLKRPRVALVKQDCNEDLYCCPPGLPTWETISTTLLRSGPVDFFTFFDTSFILLRTELDPECNIWREKVDPLGWAPREWFENFRQHVPGRDYGQSLYAQPADQINWSDFDLVISIDVSVPARITRQYPGVVWCYYVREIKTPSWQESLRTPITGQDLYLSQLFPPLLDHKKNHVVDFPYHFQHVGVFHQLVPGVPAGPDEIVRTGVFVEYHSARQATDQQLRELSAFGPVYAHRSIDEQHDPLSGERIPDRTMAVPALKALLHSKYHVKWAGRPAFGTAKVEAIAAGCLCLTDPTIDGTTYLHSRASLAHGFDGLLQQLKSMEQNHASYLRELRLQRQRIDYLCCYRPANDLLDACDRVLKIRLK